MKSMTCQQLGGACDKTFSASTFEEIAQMSQQHGKEMFEQADPDHLKAMATMKALMQKPDAMEQWFDDKRRAFEALPED
ncbi:MAG: hypothetical protein WA888_03135 [Burkholderiaceae bacterium]